MLETRGTCGKVKVYRYMFIYARNRKTISDQSVEVRQRRSSLAYISEGCANFLRGAKATAGAEVLKWLGSNVARAHV